MISCSRDGIYGSCHLTTLTAAAAVRKVTIEPLAFTDDTRSWRQRKPGVLQRAALKYNMADHGFVSGEQAMNQLLQQAFERASELPEEEQDRLARFLLAELESERQWTELFARPESEDLLERLADVALSEHRAGRTRPLSLDDL